MKKSIILPALLSIIAVSCTDFLTKISPHAIESEYYFSDESSLKIYTNGLIRTYATEIKDLLDADKYADTQAWDTEYSFYTDRYGVSSSTSWSWTTLRSINYFIENMGTAEVAPSVMAHYQGVGRFFRAMFYINKMQRFGAVPWYDYVIDPSDKESLYKSRDDRSFIASKILEDLNYACENCLGDDKYRVRSTNINKYVALGIKARFCLYEGTYRKYHSLDLSKGTPWTAEEKNEGEMYLRECIKACEEIMDSKLYHLTDNSARRQTQYRDMFTCADGCSSYTNEFIWARDYDETFKVYNKDNSINDYLVHAGHYIWALNRDFMLTYLCLDGTPFTDKYSGKDYYSATIADEAKDRDYRFAQTVRTPGFTRDNGTKRFPPDLACAKTGYQPVKWLTDAVHDEISDATYTDVPLIRYAEILLSYAEAKAELGECTQEVWDKSVKLVRERAGVKSIYPTKADPYLVDYFLNTVTDPVILEIRRERGTEFPMEGLRIQDVKRWHIGERLIMPKTGIWISGIEQNLDLDGDGQPDNYVSAKLMEKAGISVLAINYNGSSLSSAGHHLSEGDHGYIIAYSTFCEGYTWSEKKYLFPIPSADITLNEGLGQNYGW